MGTSARIQSLATAVPSTLLIQNEVRDVFADQPGLSRLALRILGAAFDGSGIETRHTVLEELQLDRRSDDPVFFDGESRRLLSPSTKVRNELYITEATRLFVDAGRDALEQCADIRPSDVTHVITVSCTGFFAPGPDYMLVRELGISPAAQRYHLGFMGCYASMPALRLAKSFCDADPHAVVLVVSVELCTLHVRSSNDSDLIIASSLFADGAGAAVVSARDVGAPGPQLGLDAFETVITPVGEGDMAWTIGDQGFEMVLSSYVPQIIDDHITDALQPLFAHEPGAHEQPATSIQQWAIHPGGRSILDKVESRMGLDEKQLRASREVLRDFGNMSSATILFVLRNLLDGAESRAAERGPADPERVCAMAFGPGLTVETALMTVLPPSGER
ncbi:type III polyketide synthase [Gryllotalpicola reticulitermitis]|uniref:Type III polyketide synthase n=1 Tax=Gryllotalpicola reticulitermitis TaxID=1184153 RepID=A0ABV8Q226_9MICO